MDELLGSSLPVFMGLTVIIFGGCALMMGQVLARNWRSPVQVAPYSLLLAFANRFLAWSLFGSDAGSVAGFIADLIVILLFAYGGFYATRASKMVSQYPWLYERASPFTWRPRQGG